MFGHEKRDIRDAELKRKLPMEWTEGESSSAWKLPLYKEYCFACGGKYGPSQAAKTCCQAQSLVALFIFFFPTPPIDMEMRIGFDLFRAQMKLMMVVVKKKTI
jgi:hypothetical protein